jgi:hypothetical protein
MAAAAVMERGMDNGPMAESGLRDNAGGSVV